MLYHLYPIRRSPGLDEFLKDSEKAGEASSSSSVAGGHRRHVQVFSIAVENDENCPRRGQKWGNIISCCFQLSRKFQRIGYFILRITLTCTPDRKAWSKQLPGPTVAGLLLLSLKAVHTIGAAIFCRSFSRAIRPPVRSKQDLAGLPNLSLKMQAKIFEGNEHVQWLASVV